MRHYRGLYVDENPADMQPIDGTVTIVSDDLWARAHGDNNGTPAEAPAVANKEPPNVPPAPPPPVLKSPVPQYASDIRPEFRARYLAERSKYAPGLFVWDGTLWIDVT
jgi:hypothetical protein